MRLRLLDRYVLSELLYPFIFGIASFSSIFIASSMLFKLTQYMTKYGASGENIARLYQRKHYYFVPYGQDDPQAKPQSLKARFALLPAALDAALEGRQLQPVLCPAAGHGMSFQQGKSVVY